MIPRFVGACAAMLCIGVLSGCGTVASLSGADIPKVYGGVKFDTDMVHTIKSGEKDVVKSLGIIYAADVPFSFMADTVTLPITLSAALIYAFTESPAADGRQPAQPAAKVEK